MKSKISKEARYMKKERKKKRSRTILIWNPKVTPIGKKGKKYIYKISGYKGKFLLVGNVYGTRDVFKFKKINNKK